MPNLRKILISSQHTNNLRSRSSPLDSDSFLQFPSLAPLPALDLAALAPTTARMAQHITMVAMASALESPHTEMAPEEFLSVVLVQVFTKINQEIRLRRRM